MRLISVWRRLVAIRLALLHRRGHYMAQQGDNQRLPDTDTGTDVQRVTHRESLVCEDSAMRRKFLDFCEEQPSAPECLLYEV
jgi:hypothetical protein